MDFSYISRFWVISFALKNYFFMHVRGKLQNAFMVKDIYLLWILANVGCHHILNNDK